MLIVDNLTSLILRYQTVYIYKNDYFNKILLK